MCFCLFHRHHSIPLRIKDCVGNKSVTSASSYLAGDLVQVAITHLSRLTIWVRNKCLCKTRIGMLMKCCTQVCDSFFEKKYIKVVVINGIKMSLLYLVIIFVILYNNIIYIYWVYIYYNIYWVYTYIILFYIYITNGTHR